MPVIRVDGLRLNVHEWGSGPKVLVALHGIRGYGGTFAALAAALQPGWRVIAPDQRGRGESDWDPARNYYTDTYLADLLALLDALQLDRITLLGHSMGGIVALVMAQSHPDRLSRLIIEDAGPGAFEESKGGERIRRELAEAPDAFPSREAAWAYLRALRPGITDAQVEARLEQMTRPAPGGGLTWRHDHAGISATRLSPDPARVPDLWPCVRAISCPTLLVRGGNSDYLGAATAQAMAAANPLIKATTIEGAGHYVHDDRPAEFIAAVRGFLG